MVLAITGAFRRSVDAVTVTSPADRAALTSVSLVRSLGVTPSCHLTLISCQIGE